MKKSLRFLFMLIILTSAVYSQTSNTLTSKEKKDGWVLLFDGISTNGWITPGGKPVPAGWEVKDGCITAVKDGKGGDILTVGEYSDFEFSVDYNIETACNSGIKYFYTKYPTGGNLGMEYQIIDDIKGEDINKVNHLCGSFYDVLPVTNDKKKVNAPGEWNTIRVTSVGGRYHYQDDWQTPDTQIITMDFPGRVSLMWEYAFVQFFNALSQTGAERRCAPI